MFPFFRPKPLLDPEVRQFLNATFDWLLRNFGGEAFEETQLVLPTPGFFPNQVDSVEQAAAETFRMVKKHAGMED